MEFWILDELNKNLFKIILLCVKPIKNEREETFKKLFLHLKVQTNFNPPNIYN